MKNCWEMHGKYLLNTLDGVVGTITSFKQLYLVRGVNAFKGFIKHIWGYVCLVETGYQSKLPHHEAYGVTGLLLKVTWQNQFQCPVLSSNQNWDDVAYIKSFKLLFKLSVQPVRVLYFTASLYIRVNLYFFKVKLY